jgi:hypothetical protein
MAMDIETQLSNLIDDKDFQSIDSRMARFNIFEAIGAIRGELRHSNFLAFLLSPNRSHDLGSAPLLRVLRAILSHISPDKRPIRALTLVVGDLEDTLVYRERYNIDLLIEIRSLKLVVAIENKVDAKAGDGQLDGYRKTIDANYPGWQKLLVFLTPDGRASGENNFVPFSYAELGKIIESFLADSEDRLGGDTKLVLRHYLEVLRRHIVPDEELRNLAQQLYERHREAFEFVFECRPGAENLISVVSPLMQSLPDVVEDKHVETMLRFLPKSWIGVRRLSSVDPSFWTKTGRAVLFEIKSFSDSDRLIATLILGACDPEFRTHLYKIASAQTQLFRGVVKPMGKQYSTIYSRELLSAVAAKSMNAEQKHEAILTSWKEFTADFSKLTEEVLKAASTTP